MKTGVPFRRMLAAAITMAIAGGTSWAGHEITFYPSFYPQEITVKRLDPATAASALEKSEVQAYLAGNPFAGRQAPDHVRFVESLRSLVVLTFDAGKITLRDPAARCAAGTRVQRALAAGAASLPAMPNGTGEFVAHPYPVTPLHPDWIAHWDLAKDARARAARTDTARAAEPPLRVKAATRFADALVRGGFTIGDRGADAMLEEIDVTELMARARGTPWPKAGWYQAAQLSPSIGDDDRDRAGAMDALARRERGQYRSDAERVELERNIVTALARPCARVVLGYTVRRQAYSAEYSNGVENVAWDSHAGLTSAIFLRTVKLKDFPWNGWLTLGVADRPRAAWNPVAGFTDPTGSIVWDTVGDVALLPSPYADGWLPNRVRPLEVNAGPIEIPPDALVPDRTTGSLKPAEHGGPATARITYRVLGSAFHDGTKMSRADLLAPYVFAVRTAARDPEVKRATARLRERLAAVRIVRFETEIKEVGELHLFHQVALVEVYLRGDGDAGESVSVAPPWSTVPWEVIALMDEAVARGLAAFSEREAARRGVPWLDLVRDARLRPTLASITDALAARAFVPEGLKNVVTPNEARERWASLRRFAREHHHYLIANGPYRLGKVTSDAIVLPVFRDLSYPIGVGTFDRWALPLRAFMTAVDARPGGLAVRVDVERVEKFERSYKIVRGPWQPQAAGEGLRVAPPVARYVVLGGDGRVVAAGVADRVDRGALVISLDGLPRGDYRCLLAVTVGDNLVNPEVKEVAWTRS